ncbi:MAG: HAD-IC family P-type ATPase [Acidobacteria bacterium]|nr:HAD-IC family P-type ATPase [Acidobacteriota bacterium]
MSLATGLSAAEVAERVADGRVNNVPDAPVRTLPQILRANVFTPVNAIMSTLFVLILIAGYPEDGLFVGVVISNSVIGISQELRARKTLHNLTVLSAPKARVLRDGAESEVALSEVVADDLLSIETGDQIVVDGEVVDGVGLEIDESLLTGEAEAVLKDVGDQVLSGSFVAAGSGHVRAQRIGAESYASTLAEEARRFQLADSELRQGVNVIMRWLMVIIPPVSILLLIRLLNVQDEWQDALQGMVAATVAMVPDGLVLLTSLAFIAGVIVLARHQALAKELATVELLARVNTLCLDKTGTITTGEISLGGIEPLRDTSETTVHAALGAMAAADQNPNASLAAVASVCADPGWVPTEIVPFSSARKWASASFEGHGTFYLGAPDILFDDNDDGERVRMLEHAREGRRVLLLARAVGETSADSSQLSKRRDPIAFVLLEDTIKPDAAEIFAFFAAEGVDLRVISGDHPDTVAAVARRAGIAGADVGYDATTLPDEGEEFDEIVRREVVFGRVTPHQKRSMVGSLQRDGRIVAMTGDGVNDVLALKDSDMGIAMGSGSSATRAVAQLVLLDNKFSTLPRVLSEGRRVINNVERVANLFISKATYAVLITLIIVIIGSPFPFLPRQLTLIGTFSIGIPGFFLALAPDSELVRPGFLSRTLWFSLPAGACAGTAAVTVFEIIRRGDYSIEEARTAATICLLVIALTILIVVARPLRTWKVGLVVAMGASYAAVASIPMLRDYFELERLPAAAWTIVLTGAAIGSLGVIAVPWLTGRLSPNAP